MSSSSSSGFGSAPNPFDRNASASEAPSLKDSIAAFAAAFANNPTAATKEPSVANAFSSASFNPFNTSTSRAIPAFPTFGEPVKLGFEPSILAATPHTLRLAQLWPDDTVTQQYLTAVIDLSLSVVPSSSLVLTTPAAVMLANCGLHLAGYLIGRACESGTNINATHVNVSREVALQQFKLGGWAGHPPLPRQIVDRWWEQAKEKCLEFGIKFSAVLDDDSEQYVCGFIISCCLKLLIETACETARNLQSPFLTAGSIEFAAPRTTGNFGSVCPKVETMQFSQFSDGFDAGKRSMEPTSWVPAKLDVYEEENEAAIRILNGDCWYHNPQLLRRVAQQFVRGERRLSELDKARIQMGIRPMRTEYEQLPRSVVPFQNPFLTATNERLSRVHLLVKDAANCKFPMFLDLGHNPMRSIASIGQRNALDLTLVQLPDGRNVWLRMPPMSREIDQFEPHLSPQQQQVRDRIVQATARLQAAVTEMDAAANEIKPVGARVEQEMKNISLLTTNVSQLPSSAQFECLIQPPVEPLRGAGAPRHSPIDNIVIPLMMKWRAYAFEQIIRLSLPLLDFKRWGSTRYEDYQTADMRRQFQSCMIDAAMQVNSMQLLPTDLLNIIAEYSTIESLPYLTLEEQKQLTTSFEADLLASLSDS